MGIQFIAIHRLGHNLVGAGFVNLGKYVGIRGPGNHDDRHRTYFLLATRPQGANKVVAIHTGGGDFEIS